jgi:hypothetical protein
MLLLVALLLLMHWLLLELKPARKKLKLLHTYARY